MRSPLIQRVKINLGDDAKLNIYIAILCGTILGGMLALAITPR